MTRDPVRGGDLAVVARADIARLTLRLRAAQREAAEAETAADAAADPSAVVELEARLETLIEQRRDALNAELDRVRDEALHAIADARRQADAVLARFAPQPAAPVAPPASAQRSEFVELEQQLHTATARAAIVERRAAELDAGLRATVEAFRVQLADLEREHPRRLTTIRAAAQADVERIMTDARRRESELMAEIEATRTSWSADAT